MANEDAGPAIDFAGLPAIDREAGYNPGKMAPKSDYATLAMMAQQAGMQPQRSGAYDRAQTMHTSAQALKALYQPDPSQMNFGATKGSGASPYPSPYARGALQGGPSIAETDPSAPNLPRPTGPAQANPYAGQPGQSALGSPYAAMADQFGGPLPPPGAGGEPQISYRIHPPAPGEKPYQAPDYMAGRGGGAAPPPGQPRVGPSADNQWSNVQLDQRGQPVPSPGPGRQPFATTQSPGHEANPNSWKPPPPPDPGAQAQGGAAPGAGQGLAGDRLAAAVGPPPQPPQNIKSDQDVKANFDRTHPGLVQQNPKLYWESLGQQLHANKMMSDQINQQFTQQREHWQQSYDFAKAVMDGNQAEVDKNLKQTETEMNVGAALSDKAQKAYDKLKEQMTSKYGIDQPDEEKVGQAGKNWFGGTDQSKANAVKDLWAQMQAQQNLIDRGQKMITDAGARWDGAHKIVQQQRQGGGAQQQGATPQQAPAGAQQPPAAAPQPGDQSQAAPAQGQAPAAQASAPGAAPQGITGLAKDLVSQFNKEPPVTPHDQQIIQDALVARAKETGTYGSLNIGTGALPKLVKHAMDAINQGIPRAFVMQMIKAMNLADQIQAATPSVHEMGQRLRQPMGQ